MAAEAAAAAEAAEREAAEHQVATDGAGATAEDPDPAGAASTAASANAAANTGTSSPDADAATKPAAAESNSAAQEIASGYAAEGAALELGTVVVDGTVDPTARVRIPMRTLNRHGLVAGATGTGKTKTLQGIAEQLSQAGVPVVLADIKGDLSGLSQPGRRTTRSPHARRRPARKAGRRADSPRSSSRSAPAASACRSARRSPRSARCC